MFFPILSVLATFWNIKTPIFFFFIFQLPIFVETHVHQYRALITRVKHTINQYSGIVWAENSKNSISRYRKYSQEKERKSWDRVCFIFGNVRQFISNSNSSNTKYFYDRPISNSSNTLISNYFLTVRTKEEFTVVHILWNPLLLELSQDIFNTVQICYRHMGDVHEEVWCWIFFFFFGQTYRVFNLAIFGWLHQVNNGW